MRNRFSQNLEFAQSIRLFFVYHIFLTINQFQQKQNPHVERTRVDDWLYGCERRDGSVLPSAKEKYEEVKDVQQRRITNGEGSTDDVDIRHDALAEVFVKEKKNRGRGVGSNTTQMQLEHAAVANVLLNQISASSIVAVHADVAKFTSKFNTDLSNVKSLLMVRPYLVVHVSFAAKPKLIRAIMSRAIRKVCIREATSSL